MATTSTQPELEVTHSSATSFESTSTSDVHRWVDLGLVLAVGFTGPIMRSIDAALNPALLKYSNGRIALGIMQEMVALLLFLVLFKRQGRTLKNIGLDFHWTDLPKALGLITASFVMVGVVTFAAPYIYSLITGHSLKLAGPTPDFSACSIWLILPFTLLNPFFEEILVRGYLMTEIIDLRKSVVFAVIISVTLQTSYHLYYGMFEAFIVGSGLFVFAIYYAKSRRLMPVILAHLLWDFPTVLSKLHHS